jgi:hypothetical protein
MKLLVILGLVSALALTGCWHLEVGPASPRPNVMLAADRVPAALVLSRGVIDDDVIPATGSVNEVPVHGWRGTLATGFHNAFAAPGSLGRKLELLEAELSFAPAAAGYGGTAAVVAQIRFKARLLDAQGKELGALANTVKAREPNTSATEQGMTINAAKAVEALYEMLASDLLAKN